MTSLCPIAACGTLGKRGALWSGALRSAGVKQSWSLQSNPYQPVLLHWSVDFVQHGSQKPSETIRNHESAQGVFCRKCLRPSSAPPVLGRHSRVVIRYAALISLNPLEWQKSAKSSLEEAGIGQLGHASNECTLFRSSQ